MTTFENFFNWHGTGVLTWHSWGLAHILAIVTILVVASTLWVFKFEVRYFLIKRQYLLTIFGWFLLVMFFLNRFLLIFSTYPNRWEIFPLHLCRLAFLLYGILLVTKRYHYVKYICFWSVLGTVMGLTLVNMGNLVTADGHILGIRSVGVDSYWWWDYFVVHGLGLITPMLIWITFSFQITYKGFLRGSTLMLAMLAMLAFVLDWSFAKYGVNYFYLGTESGFAFPLPNSLKVLTTWPFNFPTYFVLAFLAIHIFYWFYALQNKYFIRPVFFRATIVKLA